MFQTESNGIKLTQMTHLEHHVTNHVTYHVTNNLNFESGHLINRIQWVIQSGTSLKTDNLSKCSLSRTQTRPNTSESHVRLRTVGQARTKTDKFLKFKAAKRGQSKRLFMSDISGSREIISFEKKVRQLYSSIFCSIITWSIFRVATLDMKILWFSCDCPRYGVQVIFKVKA